jgi:hypothetical protein
MCLQFEPLHAVVPIQINTRFCHSMSTAYLFSLSSKIATLFSIKVPSCICVGAGAGEGVAAEEDAIDDLHIMNARSTHSSLDLADLPPCCERIPNSCSA